MSVNVCGPSVSDIRTCATITKICTRSCIALTWARVCGTLLVLTVVDEMCFFTISAQRQTSGLTACAEYPFARVCHAAAFRRKGRRSPSTATPRGRPPQTRNDHDPPHTTEGLPQARQAAAHPIRCSFHLLPILVYRKGRLCSDNTCRQRSDVTLLGWRGHHGCERHDTFNLEENAFHDIRHYRETAGTIPNVRWRLVTVIVEISQHALKIHRTDECHFRGDS